jgi:hypothetical protein
VVDDPAAVRARSVTRNCAAGTGWPQPAAAAAASARSDLTYRVLVSLAAASRS